MLGGVRVVVLVLLAEGAGSAGGVFRGVCGRVHVDLPGSADWAGNVEI